MKQKRNSLTRSVESMCSCLRCRGKRILSSSTGGRWFAATPLRLPRNSSRNPEKNTTHQVITDLHAISSVEREFWLSPRGLTFTWWGFYGLCLTWTNRACPLLFQKKKICSDIYFCLYGLFNCISFHKFSRQLSVFWFCSSGLVSASLILSTIYLFMKSLSPDMIHSGWLGSKHQVTNFFTSSSS